MKSVDQNHAADVSKYARTHKFNIVIIGSGMSSLTCAAILSKKGYSVCVLEQYQKFGGYMHCFNRFGERFDTGAHYTGAMDPGQPFHTLLNYLGAYDSSQFVALDPDGFDVFKFPKFEFELPKGYDLTIKRLGSQFPTEKDAIQQYFRQIQEVVQYFPTYEFNDDHLDSLKLVSVLETSLKTVVERLTKNPSLQGILFGHCALHGVLPHEISFGLHAIMVDSLIRGPYGFAKGGESLTGTLVDVIRKNGGTVLLKKKVERIETKDKIAQAIITADGERFEADWVISGCHPKSTFKMVDHPEIFSPAFRDRMGKIKETIGIFGIYGIYSEPKDFNRLKNYYYFSSPDISNLLEFKDKPHQPSAAFICPAARTPGEGAAGVLPISIHAGSPIEWFNEWRGSDIGKRPLDYKKTKKEYAEQIFNFIDNFHPGMRSKIVDFRTSTPLTNLYFNGSEEGSAYGIYHSIQNTGARALGPRTHIPNLLITGQSTLFPGILGAAVSAIRAAGHIVGMKPILKELKELKKSAH